MTEFSILTKYSLLMTGLWNCSGGPVDGHNDDEDSIDPPLPDTLEPIDQHVKDTYADKLVEPPDAVSQDTGACCADTLPDTVDTNFTPDIFDSPDPGDTPLDTFYDTIDGMCKISETCAPLDTYDTNDTSFDADTSDTGPDDGILVIPELPMPPQDIQPPQDITPPSQDTAPPLPDIIQPQPDTIQPPPDVSQPQPDISQPLPDTTPPPSDTNQSQPDTVQPPPVDAVSYPDTTIYPDVSAQPDAGKYADIGTDTTDSADAQLEADEGLPPCLPKPEECNGEDDNCDGTIDEGFSDIDDDGVADCTDEDDDNDLVIDIEDNCPLIYNPSQKDTDQNGIGDACEKDADGDGINDDTDNCKTVPNTDQLDNDADNIGNACDAETCDEIDNNGNGVNNETFDVGAQCFEGVGACLSEGVKICAGLNSTKCPAIPETPAEEICDGKDNDCNGATDEDYTPYQITCGAGECKKTITTSCTGGIEETLCTPGQPTDEICDGNDNNCNGLTDEALPDSDNDGKCNDIDCEINEPNTKYLVISCPGLSLESCWDALTVKGDAASVSIDYFTKDIPFQEGSGIRLCYDKLSYNGTPDPAPIACLDTIFFEVEFFGKFIWNSKDSKTSLFFNKSASSAGLSVYYPDGKEILFNMLSCEWL